MDQKNLAKIFSQCLIKFEKFENRNGDEFDEVENASKLVLNLLENFWELFEDVNLTIH
jgi:hypothetical protein